MHETDWIVFGAMRNFLRLEASSGILPIVSAALAIIILSLTLPRGPAASQSGQALTER